MAGTDDPISASAGVISPQPLRTPQGFMEASEQLAKAKEEFATAFLRAKISSRNPTDRQAEASAQVEAGRKLQAAEATYFLAQQLVAAAARRGEIA